jgi:putative ABC transport system permease protein
VLSTDISPFPLGASVKFPNVHGAPTLTVVGYAQSITDSGTAWVEPDQTFALADPGSPPTYQMLYRFAQAGTDAQILADRSAVSGMLPKDALIGGTSYLATLHDAQRHTAPFVPFIVAFGVLALATAVLTIMNVVSGAVGAAVFKIGVLKALGSTPAQVVRSYALIALLPSAIGVVLGVVLGNVLAAPLLHNAEVAYGTGSLSVPIWTDLVIPVAALALVALCAVIPALRAGRMSATAALAIGRAPRPGRGRFVRRFLAGLPIPQPVGLGLGTPPTRPARYLSITVALVFGTMALTFAVGLASSLNDVNRGLHPMNGAAVNVLQGELDPAAPGNGKGGGGASGLSPADAAAVKAAIDRESGTAGYYSLTQDDVTVIGSTTAVTAVLYTDATTSPYQIISGSWYTGPDQVLAPTSFLSSTGTRIGDTINLVNDGGERAAVRIVGEVLDGSGDRMELIGDAATFPGTEPSQYSIMLKPGVDITAYLQSLNSAISAHGAFTVGNPQQAGDQTLLAVDAIAAALTLLVVGTAGLGVFNTVMLELRDRIRELGIYKAVGMTPRQTIAMVMTSTVAVGLVAGAIGVPAGIALHDYVIPVMGHAADTGIPRADIDVFGALEDALLVLGGVAIAVLAAMIPAGWAGRLRTATALRTE